MRFSFIFKPEPDVVVALNKFGLKKFVWFFILSTRIFGSCLNTETGFRFI